MNTHSNHDATIKSARQTLNSPASSVLECTAAKSSLDHVLAAIDFDLEEKRAQRKALLASTGSAAEVEKAVKRHDEASGILSLKSEIAVSTAASLDVRIKNDRAAAEEARRSARYDEAVNLGDKAFEALEAGLGRLKKIARALLRQVAEAEREIADVNAALPAGAAPIAGVEVRRRGRNTPPPSEEVIHFKQFVDENGRRVGEEDGVRAEQAADGTWSVSPWRGTIINRCKLVELVRVVTTRDGRIQPELLASALRVPGLFDGDAPGWESLKSPYPNTILAELDRLEAMGEAIATPKVQERTMTLAQWEEQKARAA